MLSIASLLLILIGFAHSILGEKYILMRLFKTAQVPNLFGSNDFTKQTLRFAWHLTTLSWWGIAGIIFIISKNNGANEIEILRCIGATFFLSGVCAAWFTKGKHLSWIVFFTVAAIVVWMS